MNIRSLMLCAALAGLLGGAALAQQPPDPNNDIPETYPLQVKLVNGEQVLTIVPDVVTIPDVITAPPSADQPPLTYDDLELDPREDIRQLQDVAPLPPSQRLRPATPGSASPNMQTAQTILGPPTLISLVNGRGRASLVSRGRNTAPSMIGDFFGGIGGTGIVDTQVLTPIGQAVFLEGMSVLDGINVAGPFFTTNGAVFGLQDGGLLTDAPGAVVNNNGVLQSVPGLSILTTGGQNIAAPPGSLTATNTGTQSTPQPFSQTDPLQPPVDVYDIQQSIQSQVQGTVPYPGGAGGALVGRPRINENTSPMPRDRVFFNYSYFNNVPLLASGVDVNRFTPGFEKTFFDRMASFEMRFPFATTLSNDVVTDGTTNLSDLLFGDMSLTGKALLYTDDVLALSVGLQTTVPTADDLHLYQRDGTELLRVENEAVHLMPFVGVLYTPNDRSFTQGFLQVDTPANGNPVLARDLENNFVRTGSVTEVSLIHVNIGTGYWLYRNDDAPRMTGFTTTAELHYNRSLNGVDPINTPRVRFSGTPDNIEVLNVVVGGHLHFGQNSTLSIGYGTPIGNSSDQLFDGELRVSLNYRFGAQNFQTRSSL